MFHVLYGCLPCEIGIIIAKYIDTGLLDKDYESRYPNMKNGMTMFYAASEKNNSKEAQEAREIAYMEGENKNSFSYSNYQDNKNSTSNASIQNYASDDVIKIPASPKTFFDIIKSQDEDKKLQFQPAPKYTVVYDGHIDPERKDTDLEYGTYTEDDLKSVEGIKLKDFKLSEEEHIKRWKALAKLTSMGKMQEVNISLIDHFVSGTGTEYRSNVLTKTVSDDPITKQYMKDFAKVFNEQFQLHNGDISAFADSQDFRDALSNNGVLLSTYDYYGLDDILGGLTMAVHSWTENIVETVGCHIEPDGTYTGMLKFTFKDNFGLDPDDVKEYDYLSGFRSWFILQHSNEYEGKYKPFKTVVELYYPISGKIEGYK